MLKVLFSMFGDVEKAYVIPDKDTGQSKGCGFVVMASDAQAQAAIKVLNDGSVTNLPSKLKQPKAMVKNAVHQQTLCEIEKSKTDVSLQIIWDNPCLNC